MVWCGVFSVVWCGVFSVAWRGVACSQCGVAWRVFSGVGWCVLSGVAWRGMFLVTRQTLPTFRAPVPRTCSPLAHRPQITAQSSSTRGFNSRPSKREQVPTDPHYAFDQRRDHEEHVIRDLIKSIDESDPKKTLIKSDKKTGPLLDEIHF